MEAYREQHKKRLSWMPWLYFKLKPAHRAWAEAWQREVQEELMRLETVEIAARCFVAPEAVILAEPGRPVLIGPGCSIAADAFLHGPVTLGEGVSINHRCSIDGGSRGVRIGDHTRVAHDVTLYAFNHGISPERRIGEQPVRSEGITIGSDCWIGAGAGLTDGVRVGDGAVVGMGAVVTHDVPAGAIVAGVPARVIGQR